MPIDLERAELRKKLWGYDRAEVERLINGAAKSLQEALMENVAIRQDLERLRAEVETVRRQEDTLRDVLVVAQRAADETRAVAHREAETILEEARQAAQAERNDTQRKLSETRWEIERLTTERQRVADELRVLLERHLRELDPPSGPVA